jgi:broad specificity phosphatase PhoE
MAILIIRHGEKPEAKEDPHLSEKGRQRAQALVALFRTCFRAPDKLYAAADKPKSYRPRETLEPIARAFGLEIDASTGESAALAERLRDEPDTSLVLVSWRHELIPNLARGLGASDVPADWPDDL